MYSIEYKLLSLTLVSAWPIWVAGLISFLLLVTVLQGPWVRRLPIAGVMTVAVLGVYAALARPGFEGWAYSSRPDTLAGQELHPVFTQHKTRSEHDPRDFVPGAYLSDYLSQNWDGSDLVLLAIISGYERAAAARQITADQYAQWAQVALGAQGSDLIKSSANPEKLVDEALVLDPSNVRARFLEAVLSPNEVQLPKLRDLAADISPSHRLAVLIDDQILLAVVGDEPAVAPDISALNQETLDAIATQSSGTPVLEMVARLEAQLIDEDGNFLSKTGDMVLDQERSIALFRLAKARIALSDVDAAVRALDASVDIGNKGDGVRFWLARTYWNLGDQDTAIGLLVDLLAMLDVGSPEWRALKTQLANLD